MDSRSLFQNKSFEFDGIESPRRRELRHPPSTNRRYTTMLDNLEELEKKDVHEPVTNVSGMADM